LVGCTRHSVLSDQRLASRAAAFLLALLTMVACQGRRASTESSPRPEPTPEETGAGKIDACTIVGKGELQSTTEASLSDGIALEPEGEVLSECTFDLTWSGENEPSGRLTITVFDVPTVAGARADPNLGELEILEEEKIGGEAVWSAKAGMLFADVDDKGTRVTITGSQGVSDSQTAQMLARDRSIDIAILLIDELY
jgi:hypothetical protein